MIFTEFVICVLIYVYLKFERDPSSTSQVIGNYISDTSAVALSVCSTGWAALSQMVTFQQSKPNWK